MKQPMLYNVIFLPDSDTFFNSSFPGLGKPLYISPEANLSSIWEERAEIYSKLSLPWNEICVDITFEVILIRCYVCKWPY